MDNGNQLCVVLGNRRWISKDCAVENPFVCKLASSNRTSDFTTPYPITTPTVTLPCDKESPNDGWLANPKDPQAFCYLFHHDLDNRVSYQEALHSCRSLGANLVSIHSEDENAFVVSNLNKQDAWIGYNSMYSGDWEWSDGSDVGYNRWSPGGTHHFLIQTF